MLILMLETHRGSDDGHTIRQYHEGVTYNVTHDLACYFIRKFWAMPCGMSVSEQADFLAKRERHYELAAEWRHPDFLARRVAAIRAEAGHA